MSAFGKAAAVKPYRRLLRYASACWGGWVLIAVVTLLSTALALLTPWPMKILVDHVLGHEPMSDTLARGVAFLPGAGTAVGLLAWVVVAGLGIFAAGSVVDVVLTCSWIRLGQSMVYDLAGDLFAHLQRRSLLFHSRNSVGDSMSRITGDSWCVYTVAVTLLFAPAHSLITMAGMVAVMVRMDAGLTLLSLAVAPFMAGASFLLGRLIHTAAKARREIESRLQTHVQRTLSGIPVVQAFAQEEREHRHFQEFANAAIRTQQRSALVDGFSSLSSGLITTLGTGAILWIGAHRALDDQLTVGSLLIFLSYLWSLQAQMKSFTGIYATLQGARAGVDRVLEVLETAQEVADKPGARALGPVRGHVRVQNVTFGYEPGQPVLKGLCLEALPGQTLALVGATGAGKSTLVSLIPRFFDPWEGRVSIDGHDVRDVQLASLREQVALVLQDPFLFPRTIRENIAYGRPDATGEQIEAAARAANAHAFIERLPAGYDTPVGERGATLSGGERQRISIARALLKDAPILILDEPTSALDAQTEGLLLSALERLMAGRTTFIIAHRLSTIRSADQILVLEDGQVAERGRHAELLARGGLYAKLHGLQFDQPVAVGGKG